MNGTERAGTRRDRVIEERQFQVDYFQQAQFLHDFRIRFEFCSETVWREQQIRKHESMRDRSGDLDTVPWWAKWECRRARRGTRRVENCAIAAQTGAGPYS
jgi:hypothetical protein